VKSRITPNFTRDAPTGDDGLVFNDGMNAGHRMAVSAADSAVSGNVSVDVISSSLPLAVGSPPASAGANLQVRRMAVISSSTGGAAVDATQYRLRRCTALGGAACAPVEVATTAATYLDPVLPDEKELLVPGGRPQPLRLDAVALVWSVRYGLPRRPDPPGDDGEDSMKRFAWLAVAVLIVAIAAVPAQAAQADYKFKIFGGLAYVTPMADSNIDTVKFEASDEVGYEIGGEWKPLPRIGFELAYLDVSQDVEANGTKIGEFGMKPFFLTGNFFIINSDRFAWYAGPTVAFISWDDFEAVGGGSTAIDSETTFGVSTGVDLGLGEHFALIGGLRWIDSSAEESGTGEKINVDPIFARAAIAWRF